MFPHLTFSPGIFLIGLAIFFTLFLVFRVVNLWYWRINEIADSLKKIADAIEKQTNKPNK